MKLEDELWSWSQEVQEQDEISMRNRSSEPRTWKATKCCWYLGCSVGISKFPGKTMQDRTWHWLSNPMGLIYGEEVHFSEGTSNNFKLYTYTHTNIYTEYTYILGLWGSFLKLSSSSLWCEKSRIRLKSFFFFFFNLLAIHMECLLTLLSLVEIWIFYVWWVCWCNAIWALVVRLFSPSAPFPICFHISEYR